MQGAGEWVPALPVYHNVTVDETFCFSELLILLAWYCRSNDETFGIAQFSRDPDQPFADEDLGQIVENTPAVRSEKLISFSFVS